MSVSISVCTSISFRFIYFYPSVRLPVCPSARQTDGKACPCSVSSHLRQTEKRLSVFRVFSSRTDRKACPCSVSFHLRQTEKLVRVPCLFISDRRKSACPCSVSSHLRQTETLARVPCLFLSRPYLFIVRLPVSPPVRLSARAGPHLEEEGRPGP